MPRPPLARERVLDAFESLLVEESAHAATLEATAHAARVSKGGLLYHFASKDDLTRGLLQRLQQRASADLDAMSSADRGPVDYFVRTSVMLDEPFDRTLLAVMRLGQAGNDECRRALRTVREQWSDALRPHVRDEAALALVLMVSDGLYFNNGLGSLAEASDALAAPLPEGEALDELIALVLSATR